MRYSILTTVLLDTTAQQEGEIEIDIDKNGKVIGIEFVNASSILPLDFLKNQTGSNSPN
ncbi:Protein of unknown function [Corynebacterium coyleae]|uniref:DUF2283 domain-containing protein n=1 Tax=Corynebacterium coyleae TaxID=53374 RepID=A0ABX8KWL7_9CORY|nr:DUF2283 domain-containing protein [Corynebacterium coyleae]QXB19131.1 DUF2283 domain-containing protein [Corynebacterium coyleae]WJY80722.1 hypothetical protein CCOY_10760 [Corynebacterium coyleae]SEB48610.1 Protein of unknown function [Corynebacterium coyleae]